MKSVSVLFSRPTKMTLKPYAWAIMKYDGTNFDHASIKFPSSSWGCDFIYQSSGFRTNFMSGSYFNSINTVAEEYPLELDDEAYNKLGALCVSREGRPYPILSILGIAFIKCASIISFGKIKLKNPFPSANTDCIEEVAAILDTAGYKCEIDLEDSTVKPFRDWIAGLKK
jgi:hypothetical protein